MNGHALEQLEAFYDGELRGAQQRRVAAHLETCAACRAELMKIERLGVILQRSPVPEAPLPPERFVAQVRLRLRPREIPAARRRWWAIPAMLVSAWAFVQAVWIVAGGILLAGSFGLGEQLGLAWLFPTSGANLWQILQPAEQGLRELLPLLSFLASALWGALLPLALLGGISILFWGWWFSQRRHNFGR